MTRPMVHLLCGSTGAGKTSFAREIVAREQAVRFSIDEWMHMLFGPDLPDPIEFDWMMERVMRCEDVIWTMAERVVDAGRPVVLDLGYSRMEHRDRGRKAAEALEADSRFYYVTAPVDMRWARVDRRNQDKPENYAFEVTRGMFDFMEGFFEPPVDDELASMTVVDTSEIG